MQKNCVGGCAEMCNFLQRPGMCSYTRDCRPGCGCEAGLRNNGTHCVQPSACACYDKDTDSIQQSGTIALFSEVKSFTIWWDNLTVISNICMPER